MSPVVSYFAFPFRILATKPDSVLSPPFDIFCMFVMQLRSLYNFKIKFFATRSSYVCKEFSIFIFCFKMKGINVGALIIDTASILVIKFNIMVGRAVVETDFK